MRNTISGLLILIIIITLPRSVFPQSLSDHPEMQSAFSLLEYWLDAQCAYEQIPGISMGILYDQEVIWSSGFGYANPARKIPATPRTIYSICSITKLFTSIALLQLRDQGRFLLKDPIDKHLSWFKIQQSYPDSPPITIENLLTHSSGLPREANFPYWTPPNFAFPNREQIIRQLEKQETWFPADEEFQYSNLGFVLAGEIIAQMAKQPCSKYIEEKILAPLEMDNTRFVLSTEQSHHKLATGYSSVTREGARKLLSPFQTKGITPAVGLYSTVEDMARFAAWQFRLLETGVTEVLKPNTLREMHRVQWLSADGEISRGLGFAVWRKKEEIFIGHQGHCPGYKTAFVMHPASKLAIIFMSNAMEIPTQNYIHIVYKIIDQAIAAAADANNTFPQPDSLLQKFVGSYNRYPWKGEIKVFYWKGELSMTIFPTSNPLNNIYPLKHIEGNTFREIRKNGKPAGKVIFKTNREGKITGIRISSNYFPKRH